MRAPRLERARAWGAAAGVLFGLSCLCYLPRVPVLAVPLGAIVWARRRRYAALLASSTALFAGALLVWAGALAWLLGAGLAPDVLDGIRFQAESPLFTPDPMRRLGHAARVEIGRAVPAAALHLLFGAAAVGLARVTSRRGARAQWAAVALLVAAYAATVTSVYVRHGQRSVPAYAFLYAGLCWVPLALYPWLRRRLAADRPDLTVEAGLLFWMGAAQQAVATLTSTQVAAAGIPGLAASMLLLLLLCDLPDPALGSHPPVKPARAPVLGFCAALALTAALFHFYPGQSPFFVRTVAFESGRLEGLRTSRRFLRAWTGIAGYLGPRVQRGEFLLAYGNIPLLHYLTDTRPALRASYVAGFQYGAAQQGRLLETMIRRNRVPRYAVRLIPAPADEYVSPSYSTRPEVDPVNAWVLENYELEARVPPFEVFRLRAAR
jgi:hypothetical protein